MTIHRDCPVPGSCLTSEVAEFGMRVDWCDSMPWIRVNHIQRNKPVFDSPAALAASLVAPALAQMRADYRKFPQFSGGNVHYPFITSTIG